MSGHGKTKSQRKKSHRTGPTDWTEWKYYDEHQCEIRWRIDEQGGKEYDYRSTQTADVPRTTSSETEFAAHDDTRGGDIQGYGYREASPIENITNSFSRSTLSSVPPPPGEFEGTFQAGSLPSNSLPRTNSLFQASPGLAAGSRVSANYTVSFQRPFPQSQSYGGGGVPTYDMGLSTSCTRDGQAFAGGVPSIEREQPQNPLPTVQTGNWTYSGTSMAPNTATQSPPPYSGTNYNMTIPTTNVASQNHRRTPSMIDPNAPIKGVPHIGENNTNVEAVSSELSKEFTKRPSGEFKIGRVFKVAWTEPMGDTASGRRPDSNASLLVSNTKFNGVKAYTSIRRFVIVGTSVGHSIGIPILTYGGKGTTKPGVKREYHAKIYTERQPDKPVSPEVQNEQPLPHTAICMEPSNPRHVLDVASRINYSKVYTIEHNVNVAFIGKIRNDFHKEFMATFKQIQAEIGEVGVNQLLKEDDEGDGNSGGNGSRGAKGDKRDKEDKKGKREMHKSNRKYKH